MSFEAEPRQVWAPGSALEAAPRSAVAPEVYVGRQPIVDARSRLYGYELLYRDGTSSRATVHDGAAATYHVVARSLVDMGLEHLVGGHLAFINATGGFLAEAGYLLLPAERTVVEVLEDIEVTDEVAGWAASAARRGYRLALDDYCGPSSHDRLGPLVSYVKVDVLGTAADELPAVIAHARSTAPRAKLIAEKVETAQDVARCARLGFELFQGYFVGRPEQRSVRQVPASSLAALRLVAELERRDLTIKGLEDAIVSDPVLSYRLLRLINSAATSLRRDVTSVRQAIVMLGLDGVRHLATVLALTTSSAAPSHLVEELVVRAKMCETMAETLRPGTADAGPAFTVGLFSGLDALLGVPMDELVTELPLAEAVRAALVEQSGELGGLVRSAVDFQRARLDGPSLAASVGAWQEAFRSAVAWASEVRSAAP